MEDYEADNDGLINILAESLDRRDAAILAARALVNRLETHGGAYHFTPTELRLLGELKNAIGELQ